MGLDITAYKEVKLTTMSSEECEERDGQFVIPYINSDFPERAVDIIHGRVYSYAARADFRAGSYSGYGRFRNELARLAGYRPDPGTDSYPYAADAWKKDSGPFYELINFADNEGVIGTAVSKKLFADFVKYECVLLDGFSHKGPEYEWFKGKYQHFKDAFEMASQNGFIEFA